MAKKKNNYATVGLGVRLSSHEKLCAERMKALLKSIDEINKKVSKLSEDISQGKGAVKVLMALGALVVGILGYLNIK
tara:strand:- start:901 stop:1131 length:231 start_codon:yes stop_codon:yes gene_type:complete